MFRNREDAGRRLARRLRGRPLHDPLVLAIPRGGVAVAAALARELGADLDVVVSRKLRAPLQPELAVGAICEDGEVYLTREAGEVAGLTHEYLEGECRHQLAEIARRKQLFRAARPRAPVTDRSVIVTDDGIATGSTMMAALHVVKGQGAAEVIVAAPVASPKRLAEARRVCDDLVCLLAPADFWAIGQFYDDFTQVEDARVVALLREFAPATPGAGAPS